MDTHQTQEQIDTTNCGKSCSCPWQPRSEEGHDGKEQERGGLGQSDTEKHHFLCRNHHFLVKTFFFHKKWAPVIKKKTVFVSDAGRLTEVVS